LPSSSHKPLPSGRLHAPRKRFGQHFLHDQRVLARIAEAIAPQPDDFIVEIGAGQGALTRHLSGKAGLAVVEIDRDLAARLADEFPGLSVLCGDALELDFAQFPQGMRVVGNLPYNISTPLLFHLAQHAPRMRDLYFLLQLEVVERMVAKPSTAAYGRLSVALQARFAMQKLFKVGSGAFQPPPKVESALVRLEPLAWPLPVDDDLLRKAFSARRKTLRNALPGIDFEALGIDPKLRPENLSPEDYARLSMK
jgi:16S rRNA (adenine1518-N6/adenine1519-N6)-dimethyltransferase